MDPFGSEPLCEGRALRMISARTHDDFIAHVMQGNLRALFPPGAGERMDPLRLDGTMVVFASALEGWW